MQVAAIIALIQGVLVAMPQIEAAAEEVKKFVTGLFEKGLISQADQKVIHDHVDEVTAALLAGNPPPSFTVEPDPVSPPSDGPKPTGEN